MYNVKHKEDKIYKIRLPKSTKKQKSVIRLYISDNVSQDITLRMEKMSKELIASILQTFMNEGE